MSFEVRTEIPGLPPEARAALVEMQHAIKAHLDEQARTNRRPKRRVSELVEEGSVVARPGEVTRVRPGDDDIQVVLPESDAGNAGEDIIVSFEGDGTATGKVVVTPMGGTCAHPGTTTLNTPGSYRFTSTGAANELAVGETTPGTWAGPAPLSFEDLPEIASDTTLGNISGAPGTPVEVPLSSLDSASVVYDDASHTFQRAALSGAISASQDSNVTLFAGIRDNGSLETARGFVNVLSSTSIVVAVAQDAGNDELEWSWQRAALTGAIAASQDSNATVFAGIRDNGSAESDRTNLNFVSSTSNTLVVTDDSGNDELEITVQRAALTGEVTAGANSNSTTVTRSTNFQSSPWTGNHQFNAEVRLGTLHTESSASGSLNITLTAGATRVLISSTGNVTLGTISGASEGRLLVVEHLRASGAGNVTVTHSTSTNGVACPLAQDLVLGNRCCMYLIVRDGAWRVVGAATPEDGKLIAYTEYTSGSGNHVYNSRTRFRIADLTGGGGAGGGTIGGGGASAGGGGQAGATRRTAGSVTGGATVAYSVGAGGSSSSGAAGADGSDTTMDGCTTAIGGFGGRVGTNAATNNASAGGGDNATGNQGAPGQSGFAIVEGGTDIAVAGRGGDGPEGGGGWGSVQVGTGAGNGSVGRRPGAGGSGAYNVGTAGNNSGGSGVTGRICIWEWS